MSRRGKKQESSPPLNLHDYLKWGISDELITSFCKILIKILAACLKRSFMRWLCFTNWFIHGWQINDSISNQDGMDTHKSDGWKEFFKNSYSNTFLRNFYSTKIKCSGGSYHLHLSKGLNSPFESLNSRINKDFLPQLNC